MLIFQNIKDVTIKLSKLAKQRQSTSSNIFSYKVWMVLEHSYITGIDIYYDRVRSVDDQGGEYDLIRRQEAAR